MLPDSDAKSGQVRARVDAAPSEDWSVCICVCVGRCARCLTSELVESSPDSDLGVASGAIVGLLRLLRCDGWTKWPCPTSSAVVWYM